MSAMTDSDWLARVLGAMPAPISPTAADNTPADGPAPAAVLSQPENPVTKKPAKKAAAKTVAKAETSLVLRVSGPNGESTNGFVWPLTVGAAVEAPDWQATEECGHGLHGWLFGAGTHSVSTHCATPDAKWMVLEVVTADIIALGGKCKFPRGVVRFVGGKNEAAAYLLAHEPRAKAENCIGAVVAVGEGQTAAVGALGTATAGNYGTATAGDSGTATAGDKGELRLRWWDGKNQRYRTAIAYVGENGIKANVRYRLDSSHKFVEAK